jgi:hypothetical protein
MKNIHVLPTDKPSRLLITIPKGNLLLSKKYTMGSHWENKHIYITSDEEIKDVRPHKGKWQLEQEQILNKFPTYLTDLSECKLVIMTTDQELIKDGVQAIDDTFLEWFVKNPSFEFVEVVDNWNSPRIDAYDYKIIIPQEETKGISKQTAVDFLVKKFNENVQFFDIDENHQILLLQAIKQAKEMEKEQMISFYLEGCKNSYGIDAHEKYDRIDGENYYNKIYNNEQHTIRKTS